MPNQVSNYTRGAVQTPFVAPNGCKNLIRLTPQGLFGIMTVYDMPHLTLNFFASIWTTLIAIWVFNGYVEGKGIVCVYEQVNPTWCGHQLAWSHASWRALCVCSIGRNRQSSDGSSYTEESQPFYNTAWCHKGMSSFERMDIIVELFPNEMLACIVRKTSTSIWAALYHRSRSIPGATSKGLS